MYEAIEIIGDLINQLFIKKDIKAYQIMFINDGEDIDWTILANNDKTFGGTIKTHESIDIRLIREVIFMALEECDENFVRPYTINDLYKEATADEFDECEELTNSGEEITDDEG